MVEALACKAGLSGFESRRYLHFLRLLYPLICRGHWALTRLAVPSCFFTLIYRIVSCSGLIFVILTSTQTRPSSGIELIKTKLDHNACIAG